MQIDIDFEVFKALTALRQNESDSYNAVVRRLLALSVDNPSGSALSRGELGQASTTAAVKPEEGEVAIRRKDSESRYAWGIWFGNTELPIGTKFRATYKGQTYHAELRVHKTPGKVDWVGQDGIVRNSPSDAAKAITNTNVNGWRFWHAQLPGDPKWRRLDELKK